jgi:hypothetical protein
MRDNIQGNRLQHPRHFADLVVRRVTDHISIQVHGFLLAFADTEDLPLAIGTDAERYQ